MLAYAPRQSRGRTGRQVGGSLITQLHVVLGAGAVGYALAEELVGRGAEVRVVTRSPLAQVPASAVAETADVSTPDGARAACRGASVVYNCVFPPANYEVTKACSAQGAKLVLADSLAMYECSGGPMSEKTRYEYADRESGRIRAEIEERLFAAHRRGELQSTIGRASDVYGPRTTISALGSGVFVPALVGRRATVLGNPDMPHTYTFNRDFARALATLGEREEADGSVWHVPSAETITTRQILELIYSQAGHPVRIRALGPVALGTMGIMRREVRRARREKLHQFLAPFISDHSRYQAAFGAETTPHPEAVAETLQWFREY